MFNPYKASESAEQGKEMEKILFGAIPKSLVLEFIEVNIKDLQNRVFDYRRITDLENIETKTKELKSKMNDENYRKLLNQTENIIKYYDFILDNQPGNNPSEPKAKFAEDLFNMIVEKLDLKDEEGFLEYDRLKFYTCIGTGPDYNKSLDIFFELYDVNEKNEYVKSSQVLIDFTLSKNKLKNKQELILTMNDKDAEDIEILLYDKEKVKSYIDNNIYKKYINLFSDEIVAKLRLNKEKDYTDIDLI